MKKPVLGGQAVIEGVMMRSKNKYAVAVRTPENKISTEVFKIPEPRFIIFRQPFFRGIQKLVESLTIGMRSLMYSSNMAQEEDEQISRREMIITLFFSLALTVVLFVILPLFVSTLLIRDGGLMLNIVDGIVRMLVFILYLLIISSFNDIKRIFQYHGAEHKVVACFEDQKELTISNVKKYTTKHPRCGTNFLLIVIFLSILIFSVLPTSNFLMKSVLRIIFLPLIAGISYEFLKFTAEYMHIPFIRMIAYPGLLLQSITTREPDAGQIEVAISSLRAVMPDRKQ